MSNKENRKQAQADALEVLKKAFENNSEVIVLARDGGSTQMSVVQGRAGDLSDMLRIALQDEDFREIVERAAKPRKGLSVSDKIELLKTIAKVEKAMAACEEEDGKSKPTKEEINKSESSLEKAIENFLNSLTEEN